MDVEVVDIQDPKLSEFKAMFDVDRAALGIAPLPPKCLVKIERLSPSAAKQAGYDVLLHFDDPYSREMIFEKDGSKYSWRGEKVVYLGPGVYQTADVFNEKERLIVQYSDHPAWTSKSVGLQVRYFGPDKILEMIEDWTPQKIKEVMDKWGISS